MSGKTQVLLAALAVALLLALGAGYWLGKRQTVPQAVVMSAMSADKPGAEQEKKTRKLRFYRNPMGLPDTSPVPKKDSMGMDYIPVYEGDEEGESDDAKQLHISTEKIQKLGVRTEVAGLRTLDRVVRAVGKVDIDERRSYTVAPKFEGWIDQLHVNVTGQAVVKGQPLLEAYSPELVSAQSEYALANEGVDAFKAAPNEAQTGMKQLAEAGLTRLKNWDISESQIQQLQKSGTTRRTLTLRSPVNGIVMEKKAVQGMRFVPGEVLYQIADLSSVWIIAEVFERDLAQVHVGQSARVSIDAYPGKMFVAKVAYVYPTLNAQTRTTAVRLELANPQGLLKPAMYANVEFATANDKVLAVPNSAVIHSGTRQIVLAQLGEGRFVPREVKLGAQGDRYVEVLEGIAAGEQVVVTANFLIDAESNLQAAITGFTPAEPPTQKEH